MLPKALQVHLLQRETGMRITIGQIRIKGEVVKVLDLDTIEVPGGRGDAIRFRIEIIRQYGVPRKFIARIWRTEFYRIKPTFPQVKGRPNSPSSDELLWVEDTSVIPNIDDMNSTTVRGIIGKVLRAIATNFCPSGISAGKNK